MASSIWLRSSPGCVATTSRALCSRAAVAQLSVSQVLRFAACRRAYANQASKPAQKSQLDPSGPSFMVLKGKISQKTLDAITVAPYKLETMSLVQAEVLPLLPQLAEPYDPEDATNVRDLLVRAKTGTGKTLGFLVPAIEARLKSIEEHVASNPDENPHVTARKFGRRTVGALIISPTRELATQIANEALRLTHHHRDFEVRLFVGGVSKRLQMRDWMRGRKDIVVATPGRLRDLLESEPDVKNAIAETQVLILDEADTLLDMGFREDIEDIKRFVPPVPQRQTLLFSATVSREIQQIARSTLAPNHRFINCVTEETSPVHAHVAQYHTVLPSADAQLSHIIRLIAHDQLLNPGNSKVIVFFPTTKMTQLFSTVLNNLASSTFPAGKNTKVYELHSKRTQERRTIVSDAFRSAKGGATVLVTSDVSARGVDYPNVTRVIQVGIPAGREQYIHRVGRTGRAGTAGRGDLVLLPWEIGFVTWQLTDVPLQPLTVNDLKEQVNTLAAKCDESPKRFFDDAPNASKERLFPRPLVPLLEDLERNIETLLGRLDPEAVRETFLSLLGYYIAKAPELRVQKPVIVEGCKDWTMGACGLPTPPFVSVAFLQKLGLGDGRTKHFGRGTHKPSYSRNQDAPWLGRGRVKNRDQETTPTWEVQDEFEETDPDRDRDAREYRGSRYRTPDRNNGYSGGVPGEGVGYSNNYSRGHGDRRSGGGGYGGRRSGGHGEYGSRSSGGGEYRVRRSGGGGGGGGEYGGRRSGGGGGGGEHGGRKSGGFEDRAERHAAGGYRLQ